MFKLLFKCFNCANIWVSYDEKLNINPEECKDCKAMISPYKWLHIKYGPEEHEED